MVQEGYVGRKCWSENAVVRDSFGNTVDTAFILQDSRKRGLDVHAIRFDLSCNGIPAWNESEEFFFSKEDLSGRGVIGGMPVQSISVKSQVNCHTGYTIPEHQVPDISSSRCPAPRPVLSRPALSCAARPANLPRQFPLFPD
jgi:hypothetical protein